VAAPSFTVVAPHLLDVPEPASVHVQAWREAYGHLTGVTPHADRTSSAAGAAAAMATGPDPAQPLSESLGRGPSSERHRGIGA
jgi:hypothetical protein